MLRQGRALLLGVLVGLGGCASDDPHRNAPASAERYQADLDSCRSSAAAARAAAGAEGFLIGALLGAAHGAAAGAHRGGADVGAIVGASVGAVAGFFHGLKWSDGASVPECMHARGSQPL